MNNNNRNTVDTSRKNIEPTKQTEIITDPNTTLAGKEKVAPDREIIELGEWINLKPKVILNRLPKNILKEHKVKESLDKHILNNKNKENKEIPKTPIKRKLIEKEKETCENIHDSPKKLTKEPKIMLNKSPNRYINELLQKRKNINNLNSMNMVPNNKINMQAMRNKTNNSEIIIDNEQENLGK